MAVSHASPLSPTTATFRSTKRPVSTDKPLPQTPPVKQPCEDPRCQAPASKVWHCVDCDSNYCETCWDFQGPHRPGKKGRDGVPHERTDIQLARRLKDILEPKGSADKLRQLHEEDRVSKWFGLVRDQHDRPTLEDYGRYASLMGSLTPLDGNKDRFPQLVSVIGTTNAGKSTIIKMLINHMPSGNEAPSIFPTPVVGSTLHDKVPTSGDVHLYADQSTHAGQLPVLYADCEGFEGGEKLPLGARPRKRNEEESSELEAEFAQSRRFPIEWADDDDHSRREFAVTELYPRLLYTFSDVVVFVLRNPKTFQSSVLTKLLQWGASALETSINQPSLPHAIVLLNDSDPAIDPREWDTAYATTSLLSCLTEALDSREGVPLFRQLAQRWRDVGVEINRIEDLILRYYSTFKVIRMPRKPQYSLINKQIQTLHAEIRANCEVSFWAKRRARMLTTAEELNTYLTSAFEHYSRTLTVPFNFVQVSWMNNPITYDFGGHLLQLANAIAALEPSLRRDHARSQWIFDEMSILIASCVMLDCARHRKGQIKDLFEKYREFFEWALNEYCDLSLPCSYSSEEGRACQLVKARHAAKGHQDELGIIGPGDYCSRFNPQQYFVRWEAQLRGAIDAVQSEFQDEHIQVAKNGIHLSDEKIALDLHRQYLGEFFRSVSGKRHVFSHASCFCCLLEVAEHPLPCGHVLCGNCVQAYGHDQGRSTWALSSCPLHAEDLHWEPPHLIHYKPPGAGIRVLCMDGGGVRGIVQLEVLRSIEQALGGELPIRSMFDLMVGTGTGGIIALALGVRQWSVNHTIDTFGSLCDRAYASRLRGTPLVGMAAAMGYGSKYRTRSFRRALKELFGSDSPLFGGGEDGVKYASPIKVAVTATTSTADKAIALTNYRRKEVTSIGHELERPHDPAMEMKIFEAAAATSAAPTYFKPFVHPKTHRTYLDGAIMNNNPARLANEERKLIWPDTQDHDPDILLSLGTGQNRISVLPKLSAKQLDKPAIQASLQSLVKIRSRALGRLFKQYSKVDDILDAELAWATFRTEVISPDSIGRNSRRYIRFNPDLDRGAPAMDAKDQLNSLQMTVRKRLTLPHCKTALQHVAHKLIASCFYLEVKSKVVNQDSTQHFTGQILCRFKDESEELKALGRVLQGTQEEFFQPHLMVRSSGRPDRCQVIDIPHEVIYNMVEIANFSMPECTFAVEDVAAPSCINLMLTAYDGLEPDGFPISGFPRVLQEDLAPYVARTLRQQRSTTALGSLPASSTTSLERTSSSSEQTADAASPKSPVAVTPKSPRPDLRRFWHPSTESLSRFDSTKRNESLGQVVERLNASSSYRDSTKKNRFWTYIGPQHIANFPHLYPPEVLQKYAPAIVQRSVPEEAEPTHAELDNEGAIHEAAAGSVAELPSQENGIFELSATKSVQRKSVRSSDPQRYTEEPKVLLNDAEVEAQWLQRVHRKERAKSLGSVSMRPDVDHTVPVPTISMTTPPSPPQRVFDTQALEAAIRDSFG